MGVAIRRVREGGQIWEIDEVVEVLRQQRFYGGMTPELSLLTDVWLFRSHSLHTVRDICGQQVKKVILESESLFKHDEWYDVVFTKNTFKDNQRDLKHLQMANDSSLNQRLDAGCSR